MIVIHNGNEYFVTNKLTLEQLLKHGAVPVGGDPVAEETGLKTETPETKNKITSRKK